MAAISRKMERCHIVIVPTGMYATHSVWIGKEISSAVARNKPILGINPWGQRRRSGVVVGSASRIVGWNRKSVVKAIWNLYRDA